MTTRRDILRLAAAGAAGAALIPSSFAHSMTHASDDETYFTWKPAADNALVAFGGGGNSLVLRGKGATLLVDCKNAPYGDCLRREAKDVTVVVNTHHHADHTGGNHAFSKDLKIIAQTNATPRVLGQMNRYVSQLKEAATQLGEATGPAVPKVREEAMALYKRVEKLKPTDFAPTLTFDTDDTLDVGGIEVKLHHFGPGHTDNDLIVHVPSLNLIHTGDLLFHNRHPFIDLDGGASTTGWLASLAKIIALCDAKTVVIPGHGEITNVGGLLNQVHYFEFARTLIEKEFKAGKTRDDIIALKPAEFAKLEGGGIQGLAFGAIFEEFKRAAAKH
ncbi:MAG: MBL fold metallo-hydrolase [Phycisphaerales bacterium]|jgi:glyoxylase-like metal-dependent hydrolase (beta-lactamase superfamily II)